MNITSLAFTVLMFDPLLARDLDILFRAGRVQRRAAAAGHDTPAWWFCFAMDAYPPCSHQGRLARRACGLVAVSLAVGAPS